MNGSRQIRAIALLLAGLLAGSPVFAYDGPNLYPLGPYGLSLGYDRDVAIKSSHYHLTPERLDMALALENRAGQQVTTHVYLRFLPIQRMHEGNGASIARLLNNASCDASARVDENDATAERRITPGFFGTDVSADLAAANVGDLPFRSSWEDKSIERLRPLLQRGILDKYGAEWDVHLACSWPAALPPRHETVVKVTHRPVFGQLSETLNLFGENRDELMLGVDEPLSSLCLSADQEARVWAVFDANRSRQFPTPYSIRTYSLSLTSPQVGYPIRDFDMRIEPGKAGDIVSVCGGEFKEEADGAMVWTAPSADHQELKIYFLELDPDYMPGKAK